MKTTALVTREDGLERFERPAAPAHYSDPRAGTAALAAMPDDEFEVRLAAMRRGRERLARIHRELMDAETDYGVIPGTKMPTLLKPGAEKLCSFYGYAAEFHPDVRYGDGRSAPPITVVTECRLHLGTLDGPVVNTGHGACSTWEKKYRYRRGERACPSCGCLGTVIKGRAEYGGGFICFAKKGGCGAKFPDGDPGIVNQTVGDVENPDPFELLNTVLKIAEKRAYVDAVLRATATSSLYTQDLEEQDAPPAAAEEPAPQEPTGRQRTTRAERESYGAATVRNGNGGSSPPPAPEPEDPAVAAGRRLFAVLREHGNDGKDADWNRRVASAALGGPVREIKSLSAAERRAVADWVEANPAEMLALREPPAAEPAAEEPPSDPFAGEAEAAA